MDFVIEVMNCFSFAISISILFSFYENLSKFKKYKSILICFIICFSVNFLFYIFFLEYLSIVLICLVPILTIYINNKFKNILESLLKILVILNVFSTLISFFSALLLLCINNFMLINKFIYNLIFCIISILVSLFVLFFKNGEILNIKLKDKKSMLITSIFLFFMLVFLNVFLKNLSLYKDKYSLSIIVITFVIFTLGLYLSIRYIQKLELKAFEFEINNKFTEEEIIRHNEIIRLKHDFLNSIRICSEYSDIKNEKELLKKFDELKRLFSRNLNKDKINLEELRFIDNIRLRNLFFHIIYRITILPQVDLEFRIERPIINLNIKEDDLINIISMILYNIIDKVDNQNSGDISILIFKDDDKYIFKFLYTLNKNKSLTEVYNENIDILNIAAKYSNVNFELQILNYDEIKEYTDSNIKIVFIQILEIGGHSID